MTLYLLQIVDTTAAHTNVELLAELARMRVLLAKSDERALC